MTDIARKPNCTVRGRGRGCRGRARGAGGVLAVLAVLLLAVPAARGLISFGLGNDPVRDGGWPAGSLAVANLESRVVFWEGPLGDGSEKFGYRGDAAAFQQALDRFAQIEAPERVLVVHGRTDTLSFLKGEKDPKSDGRYDWRFTVWNVKEFDRLRNDPNSRLARVAEAGGGGGGAVPGPMPRIDAYVAGAPAGQGIDWSLVRVPAGVRVVDERATGNGYAASAGSVLRGRVTALASGGKPLAGARVVLGVYVHEREAYDEVAVATSGPDGRFEVTGVPPGSYSVHASAGGHVPRALGHAQFGVDTLKEYPDVRLAKPVSLSGTVRDADGKPLAGVTLRADSVRSADGKGYATPKSVTATTDASGHFALDGLPAGTFQIAADAEGLHQVEPFKAYEAPAQGVAVRMSATGALLVKLTQDGGAPAGGPYVVELTPEGGHRVGSYGGGGEAEADGTFEFERVPPGKYTVTARTNPGPEPKPGDAREVEVKAGAKAEVEIEVK